MSIKVDPDWWKTLFDDIYLLTDARSVCNDTITWLEVNVICELLPIKPGHSILDLCGGHGRHSFELYSRGFQNCTLLDYSHYLIDYASTAADKKQYYLNCIQSDARNTGLPSESFDHLIIMGNSLGYMHMPEDNNKILEEAHRLLKKGGWILIDVTDGTAIKEHFNPNAWHEINGDIIVCRERELNGDKINAREIVVSKSNGLIRDKTYAVRLYDSQSLAHVLNHAGMEQVSVQTGFSPIASDGDYGFMNHRMLAVGQKV